MSVWKSGIRSSFESPLSSSKPAQSMLALLVPGSTSLLAGTLDEGAHANSPVAAMLEYILSNLFFEDSSIPTCLNFLTPLISCILIKSSNEGSTIKKNWCWNLTTIKEIVKMTRNLPEFFVSTTRR